MFLNLEMRSSVMFFVGMAALTHCGHVLLSQFRRWTAVLGFT